MSSNMEIKTHEPILMIEAKDGNGQGQKNDDIKVYVEQTNIKEPYELSQLINIYACDYYDRTILTNKVISNLDKIDFNKPGLYTVTVSVFDQYQNMAFKTFKIQVLSRDEENKILTKSEDTNTSRRSRYHKKKQKRTKSEVSKSTKKFIMWGGIAIVVAFSLLFSISIILMFV